MLVGKTEGEITSEELENLADFYRDISEAFAIGAYHTITYNNNFNGLDIHMDIYPVTCKNGDKKRYIRAQIKHAL